MAVETISIRKDDINGDEGAVAVSFSYKGVDYTIDLGAENEKSLDESMGYWIEYASLVPARSRRTGSKRQLVRGPRSQPDPDAGHIRDWGKANGFEVSKRGRISAELRQAWEEAGSP